MSLDKPDLKMISDLEKKKIEIETKLSGST
jgi:hypothetical protein